MNNNFITKEGLDISNLFEYLEPDTKTSETYKKSKNNLLKLIEVHASDNVITFVGAGTSKPLGIPDWKELLSKLINICGDNFKNNNEHFLNGDDQLPELAEKIYQEIKTVKKLDLYHSSIKNALSPSNNTATLTLIKMLLATNIHLTTNFDRSIENAYEFLHYISEHLGNKKYYLPLTKKCLPNLEEFLNEDGKVIYYLHSNIDDDIYILRKAQYDEYYPTISGSKTGSKCIENCLRYFFINKNIIFIGFSFADRYVRKYFLELSKELERENMVHQSLYSQEGRAYNPKQYEHFLLIDSDSNIWRKERKNIFLKYEKYHILPIIYKSGMYVFLEKLFEYLSRRKINGN